MGVCSKLCLWDSSGAAAAALSASPQPPRGARAPEASSGDVRAEGPRLPGTESGQDLPAGPRLQPCKLGTHHSDPGPTASSGGTAAAARPDSASLRAQVVCPLARARSPGTTPGRPAPRASGVEMSWSWLRLRLWGADCPGKFRPVLCHQQFSSVSSAVNSQQPPHPPFPGNFLASRKLHNSRGQEGPLPPSGWS